MNVDQMLNQGHIATGLLLIATFLGFIAHALLEKKRGSNK